MNKTVVIIAKYNKQGQPQYEGTGGMLTDSLLDALKFNTHAEAGYYFQKVHGHKNYITDRIEYVYQTA